jgi:hypothetical protein
MTIPDLTPEQRTALEAFAAEHGRLWKSRLRDQWMNASATPELHRLRNTHGPSWLARFRLPGAAQCASQDEMNTLFPVREE